MRKEGTQDLQEPVEVLLLGDRAVFVDAIPRITLVIKVLQLGILLHHKAPTEALTLALQDEEIDAGAEAAQVDLEK